ncbi:MAG TPA: hypothetical protein DIT07_11620 [Sphingobacteriaceae bacterium]|nr:hypothetical protein [Sphingobacteriaceae bacterium]
MAKSKFNWLTHGMSGLLGDLMVFRQRANKTIVAMRPRPSGKEPTADMMNIRKKFKKAALYAKTAIANPALKAEYQAVAKLGQSAFNRAFKDYQLAPELEDPNLSAYTGEAGEHITVSALDDFRVESVHVVIKTGAGIIVEEGEAVQDDGGLDWVYTTTTANTEMVGAKVIFTATDLPGNKTELVVPV